MNQRELMWLERKRKKIPLRLIAEKLNVSVSYLAKAMREEISKLIQCLSKDIT